MEVPGVIMTMCCYENKYVVWGTLLGHKGNKLNSTGGELSCWLNNDGQTLQKAIMWSCSWRLHTETCLVLHVIQSALHNLLSHHYISPDTDHMCSRPPNDATCLISAWLFFTFHFSLLFLGDETTTCLHLIFPLADQWASADQQRWNQRTWLSVISNDAWQSSLIDERSKSLKPPWAKTADARSGVRNGPTECLNVCDKQPSFSPSAFLKMTKTSNNTVQNSPSIPNNPVRISLSQEVNFSYIITHWDKRTSAFSRHTNIVSYCHLVSIPGTRALLLPTLVVNGLHYRPFF